MGGEPTKLGIVGLGRWAKVLTRAVAKSDKLKIVAGYSRTEDKRRAFQQEFGIATVPDMKTLLSDPEIRGVIVTVPNEQHLPVATEIAKAGKHVYAEKPIAATLEDGIEIAGLEEKYGITITVGHSARLLGSIRRIRQAIDAGELGRVAFMEANFSNERALELTPNTWRWYKAKAPGGPLSQLAIHQFDILHYLGGDIVEASSMASKLSPVGAEVDDQSMTSAALRRRQDGLCRLVMDFTRRILSTRVWLQGSDAQRDRFLQLGHAKQATSVVPALYPAWQGRLRKARGPEGAGERHVCLRVGNVR